jgi:hypothetical protein
MGVLFVAGWQATFFRRPSGATPSPKAAAQLGPPDGGPWINAEVGPEVPLENVEAICTALERYRPYFR